MFAALSSFRSWAGKRKRLLAGVVGVAVKTASACVPGVSLAAEMLSQLAEKAIEDVFDPDTHQPLSQEQLAQLNTWMENLSRSYAGLLDRLEQLPLADSGTPAQLTHALESAIQGRDDLLREFDACLIEVRRQTLSLGVIERKLDEQFHVQQHLSAGLEEIKELFVRSPMMGEWAAFRRARPEAVRAVSDADEHFLAGRKDQGVAVMVELLRQRGVGEATLAHHLGLVELSRGDPAKAKQHLRHAVQTGQMPGLPGTLASLSTMSGRGTAAWRSLPRGFRVGRKYRIDAEVGRGGMASVYRGERLAVFEKERVVAIKVPSPVLMRDPTIRQRFEQEIDVSRRLSHSGHANIVRILDYELFDDPFTGQELYALVMEFVEGMSLAQYMARRRETKSPLKISEVQGVMEAVCAALEHAHSQSVYHRDLKPHNVMVAKGPMIKLMDFGIARVLDDSVESPTRSGQVVGTLAYLPPELLSGTGVVDARTDVYMAGTLLLELLTGDPSGDPSSREDCPKAWVDLIGASTSRIRVSRPATIAQFRGHLKQQPVEPARIVVPAPPVVPATPIARPAPALPREFTNSIGMKFVLIPKGTFRMGSPEAERQEVLKLLGQKDMPDWLKAEGPQHEVEITRPFYLGVTPVTQEQYERVMGSNPSHFSAKGDGKDKVRGMDTRAFPVEMVSWNDAVEFSKKLAALPEEMRSGRLYRLPTEAEWEYSCRGGAPSYQVFHFGNSLSPTQANFDGNYPYGGAGKGDYLQRTCKVGMVGSKEYNANGFGLTDMHGNVWEWCADWYDAGYYAASPRQDPPGPEQASARVLRSGSWDHGNRIFSSRGGKEDFFEVSRVPASK